MKTSDVLQRLVQACVDDERTLLHESKFVDAQRASALTRLAREREQFIAELERVGALASRRSRGSWAELAREAGRDVWVAAAGRNKGDAITICRHSRARTEARYYDAMHAPLNEPLPDETGRLLAEHWRRLHDEASELDQLQF